MGLQWNQVNRSYVLGPGPDADRPDERDEGDPDEAPETPLDEPRPPRVQDPPPEPDPKGPYVVRAQIGKRNGGPSGDYSRTQGTTRVRIDVSRETA
jgi:hypothetical protein